MTVWEEMVSENVKVHEIYGPGYRADLVRQHNLRTIHKDASFFIPYLDDGFRILDCGCGRGSLTIGMAQAVAGSEVLGIDIGEEVLESARADAEKAGVSNIWFLEGSIYSLEYEDDSFDAVLVHAVLQHLARPVEALNEVYRVLRTGGVVGLRDDDRGSMILAPETPLMNKVLEVMNWYLAYSSGDPYTGRKHRQMLLSAGFQNLISSATCEFDQGLAETSDRASLAANGLRGRLGDVAVAEGKITEGERGELIGACEVWGNDPAAFDSITWCETIGFKS